MSLIVMKKQEMSASKKFKFLRHKNFLNVMQISN